MGKLDEAYESKEAVAHAVQDALSHEMQQYGYRIVNTLVTDLIPDTNVMRAMNDIETQRRERLAATEKAEAKKVLVVKAAEAEMEAKHLSGQGVAKQRQAIVREQGGGRPRRAGRAEPRDAAVRLAMCRD